MMDLRIRERVPLSRLDMVSGFRKSLDRNRVYRQVLADRVSLPAQVVSGKFVFDAAH